MYIRLLSDSKANVEHYHLSSNAFLDEATNTIILNATVDYALSLLTLKN